MNTIFNRTVSAILVSTFVFGLFSFVAPQEAHAATEAECFELQEQFQGVQAEYNLEKERYTGLLSYNNKSYLRNIKPLPDSRSVPEKIGDFFFGWALPQPLV